MRYKWTLCLSDMHIVWQPVFRAWPLFVLVDHTQSEAQLLIEYQFLFEELQYSSNPSYPGIIHFTINYLSNRSWLKFEKQEIVIQLSFCTWHRFFTPCVPSPEACVKKKTITPLCFILVVCGGCWCLQTFLVRKCSSSQRKVLCLRATADKSASSVKECFICEEDSSEYKTSQISMRYPPATTAMHAIVRRFKCSAVHTLAGWSGVGQRRWVLSRICSCHTSC